MELEYNSEREPLIIPEYGRHIQKLVNHCMAIEDEEERNTMAKAIVDVMGNLQPHLRDVPDFQHKLWDQLFIMSDFKLDVESPYGKPERAEYAKLGSNRMAKKLSTRKPSTLKPLNRSPYEDVVPISVIQARQNSPYENASSLRKSSSSKDYNRFDQGYNPFLDTNLK